MAPLYSQEYVSALLAEIERGNGYLDDVRYAKGCCENAIAVREKRIAELEKKEQGRERQSVIDGLAAAGEAWADIEEYMEKWDAAHEDMKEQGNG